MYLKIMGVEDLPDVAPEKTFRIIECKDVQFYRHDFSGGGPSAAVDRDGSGTFVMYAVFGNAYILNNAGKTIDSFTAEPSTPPGEHVVFEYAVDRPAAAVA